MATAKSEKCIAQDNFILHLTALEIIEETRRQISDLSLRFEYSEDNFYEGLNIIDDEDSSDNYDESTSILEPVVPVLTKVVEKPKPAAAPSVRGWRTIYRRVHRIIWAFSEMKPSMILRLVLFMMQCR
ncbi:hypothetical protein L9F63_004299 [Diploptera punctata]|uniref:Uncharacterized protein n=1 Tax=Diploptera punctata TaxID=6984 RepID=A0AAD7ZGL7_DIPPU|nr:hypothetical protein L9F63_004299 [Diploptera punctata]